MDSLQDFTIPSLVGLKQLLNTESVLFVSGYEGLSPSQNTEICFHPGGFWFTPWSWCAMMSWLILDLKFSCKLFNVLNTCNSNGVDYMNLY